MLIQFLGVPVTFLDRPPIRAVAITLSYGTLFLIVAYSSNLKAMFTVSRSSRPESLSEALEDSTFQLSIIEGTSDYTLLSNASAGIYREAWLRVQPYPENIINFNDVKKSYKRVENFETPIGMLAKRKVMEQYVASQKDPMLYFIKEPVKEALGMMIYRKEFPYEELFNNEIERLWETGMCCNI